MLGLLAWGVLQTWYLPVTATSDVGEPAALCRLPSPGFSFYGGLDRMTALQLNVAPFCPADVLSMQEFWQPSSPLQTLFSPATVPLDANPYTPPRPPSLAARFLEAGPAMAPPIPTPTRPPLRSLPRAEYFAQSTLPQGGLAMYYNAGVMQEVLANRLRMGHVGVCNECIGYVALLHAGDLNRKVWLQWSDGVVEGPFLVADAAAPQHVDLLIARRWVVDVDFRTAQRRGLVGPTWVVVLADPSQAMAPPLQGERPAHATRLPVITPAATPVAPSGPAALLGSGDADSLAAPSD
jgi:hypothetical protein